MKRPDSDNRKKKIHLEHWQWITLLLMIYDAVAVNAAYFGALWIRFDMHFSEIGYLRSAMKIAPFYTVFCLLVFSCLRLYRTIWRYASYKELTMVLVSSAVTGGLLTAATWIPFRMPLSYYIFGAILQFILILGIRFSYRFILLERGRRDQVENAAKVDRIMLIGAGSAGRMLLRDLRYARENSYSKVCCIIDDNPNKWHRYIDGIPVAGGRDDILYCVEKYKIDKIYLAIPSASAGQKRDILNICKETECELKSLPGMYQLVNGEVTVQAMRSVAIEDLLGRDQVKVDLDQITGYLFDKVVLITGGGGSIGSELARQVAAASPRQLIIFDVYENSAYEIQQELKRNYQDLDLVTLIGSVRDSKKIMQVFARYQPQVVYHAAAHKHVPLMEDSPCEAIKNNAIGTYKTAFAAMVYGCERFVLISTDKAVNPTNIMGASKRLCEMVIQTFAEKIRLSQERQMPLLHAHSYDEEATMQGIADLRFHSHTRFTAVRFGNVLGSNGSVIPLFKKQIENGGPVTVTHPDIIRYFMTIPEAVSLVLQAGYYGESGSIYVLDMGEPVKIDTLARNLIRLSGLKPDTDIAIQYTGLRPGEKLYEEKLMDEEGMRKTPNDLIFIGSPIFFDTDRFLEDLKNLMDAAYENDEEGIRDMVEDMVDTYHPAGRQGSLAKGKTYEKLIRGMEQSRPE